jgi:riboflavin biosynthesis pyrimidine reductase
MTPRSRCACPIRPSSRHYGSSWTRTCDCPPTVSLPLTVWLPYCVVTLSTSLRRRSASVENLALPAQGATSSHAGLDLQALLNALAQRGCNEILFECGPTLAASVLSQGLCDELLLYVAPVFLGDQARPLLLGLNPSQLANALRMAVVEHVGMGDDIRLRLRPRC